MLPLFGGVVLKDKAILIVEDNIFLALDLSGAVENWDGRVVGPATTATEALRLLQSHEITAAVVDCEIADGDVRQVVMQLAERGNPVVIHTATEPSPAIIEMLPAAPILKIPTQSEVVLALLVEEVAKKAESEANKPSSG